MLLMHKNCKVDSNSNTNKKERKDITTGTHPSGGASNAEVIIHNIFHEDNIFRFCLMRSATSTIFS